MASESNALAAWMGFIQAHSVVMERLDAELEAEAGLALGWYEVLMFLDWAPDGRLPMRQLAHSVLLSKSGVTRLVDRMEAAGLVERAACASDRRVTYAAITDAGRKAVRTASPVHQRGISEHFAAHLSPAELKTLRALMAKVLAGHGIEERACGTVKPERIPARAR